jgi:Rrf2 family protein
VRYRLHFLARRKAMSGLTDFMFGPVTGGYVLFAASGYSNLCVPENGGDAPGNSLIIGGMNLSKRGEYALRALIDLGIASELGWPMLQVSELAAKEKLPIKFLEQILAQLKAAGYVEARRGKFGGYSLARPMRRIKFGAVIRLIDGPLAPIRCVSATAYERCSCPDEAHCGLRMLMFDVRNAISTVLDRFTLADIVDITLRKYRRDKVAPPFLHRSIKFASIVSKQGQPRRRGRSGVEALKQFSGSRGSQSHNGRAKGAAR